MLKGLLITVLVTMSVNAMAETHGGVIRANREFAAVYEYLQEEAGDISRIYSIEKFTTCEDSKVYIAKYSGADQYGIETPSSVTFLKATAAFDNQGQPLPITVEETDPVLYCE